MNPAELELREIRHAIDGVDDAIATLLASRRKLSRLAMLTKAKQGIPPFDRKREAEIEGRYERAAKITRRITGRARFFQRVGELMAAK